MKPSAICLQSKVKICPKSCPNVNMVQGKNTLRYFDGEMIQTARSKPSREEKLSIATR
jgi:hypothetical protein